MDAGWLIDSSIPLLGSFSLSNLIRKYSHVLSFVVVQSLSHVWLFVAPGTAACQSSLSFTISLEFAQTHVHWVGDAIQPSHPLPPPSPPAFNLSQHQYLFPMSRLFAIRWPKFWSFSFSLSPSNKYSGLISFRIDSFDFLFVQGTHKSLLQHHLIKVNNIHQVTFSECLLGR